MTDHECVQCGKAIGDKTACLDCTFKNVEIIMKEWDFSTISFTEGEIKLGR